MFEDFIRNRIMLFGCAFVACFFSVFSGLLIESRSLYEKISFMGNNGMIYGLQTMEKDDAVHLFCARSETSKEDEFLIEAGGGRITFTLSDGTVRRYESGDRISTKTLGAAVFCKVDSKYSIFAYENDFYFHEWSGIPTVSINLKRSSLEDISERKGLWCNADYAVSDVDGMQVHDGVCEVRVHGNTTFFNPKKSLDMKMEEVTPLLGMDGGTRWVLISNYEDQSFAKNAVGYTLQKQMGCEYAPETQFVNVYVNGQFQGLYLLVERPDGGSVSFTLQNEMQEVTSYMLELCGQLTYLESPNGFETKHRYVTIRYPDAIGNKLGSLADYMQKAESALYMENGESAKEYLKYFDIESFAIQYLLQEFMKNYDTELNSQYVHLTEGEKIKAGPAWDFGVAMYKPCDTLLDGADLLHIEALNDEPKIAGDMWFGAIDSHEDFHELMRRMYVEKFYPKAKQVVDEFSGITATEIKAAADMDAYMWSTNSDTFTDRMEDTTDWMTKRLEFLNEYYLNEEEYCLVTFKTGTRFDVVYPVKRNSNLGWIPNEGTWQDKSGVNAQEETFIEEDMVFYKVENSGN